LETNGAIEGAACGKCVEDNVKPRTCADYAEAAGKIYIMKNNDILCSEKTGIEADWFNVIPREIGTDGQCYECALMTCHEYDSDFYNKDKKCDEGYYKQDEGVAGADGQCYSCQKARTCRDYNSRYDTIDNIKCSSGYYAAKVGVIGSDGQCYTCEKQKTYIVFDIEFERAETPGDYRTSSWDGRGSSSLACDYRVPNACQTGTTHPDDCLDDHKAYFYSSLDWDTSAGNNFKNGNWVLPFDLEIVVTYRVPAYLCNRVEPNWNIKGDNMGVFLDRTERIFFEKGRKVESPVKRNRLTAIDFDDAVWYQNGLLNIEYKIDGKTVARATSNNGHLDTTYCDDSGCNGPKEINYFSKEIDDVVYKVDISS
ncbi:MAG: hypothetical protein Q4D80_07135, partial [Pseudomonadota bacterium]|nr:hypothetical protein [Pseudomonadota bacterium]